jgi:hypothetical protein
LLVWPVPPVHRLAAPCELACACSDLTVLRDALLGGLATARCSSCWGVYDAAAVLMCSYAAMIALYSRHYSTYSKYDIL